jgi:hypothetical protein
MTRAILIDYTPSHEDGEPEITYRVEATVGWGVHDRLHEGHVQSVVIYYPETRDCQEVSPSVYGLLGISYADVREQVLAEAFGAVRE